MRHPLSGKAKWLWILGAALVILDQVVKIYIKTHMSLNEHFYVFKPWFQIAFVENEGMAFGMSFGGAFGKYVLSTFRILLFGVMIWWINILRKKEGTPAGVLVGLTLVAAGALGNIIDCLFYGLLFSPSTFTTVAQFGGHYAPFMQGKVVDMLYFPIINTRWPEWLPIIGGKAFRFFEPVFNIADSCVTIGAFYLILFKWRFFASSEKPAET